MSGNVLILGPSGKIGHHASAAFTKAGWQVSHYTRGTDMIAAAQGMDVIVNGLNPPNYHDWDNIIPTITRQVIEAAQASGASVIIPGNVYVYGDQGGVWSANTPHEPCSRKGRIRAEMESAYRASGVQSTILRGGNFIDPRGQGDVMQAMLLRNLKRGQVISPGDPDVRQPYCYVPDWARAAVGLAKIRKGLPQFSDIPFAGHVFSVRELRDELARHLAQDLRLTGFPWWILRLSAPFWELAREVVEMRYLWDVPHELEGARLADLLPDFIPTTKRDVMIAGANG